MSGKTKTRQPPTQRRQAARSDTWQAIAVSVALAAAVLVVYSRTLSQGFLNYDDGTFVFEEPHVSAGLTWAGVRWAFTNGPAGERYPLTMLSHMLDCQIYGLEHPGGHHLTNVVLHAISAVALFWVLRRMTDQRAVPEAAQAVPASGARSGTSERREGRASGPERDNTVRVAPAGPSATTLCASAAVAALFALHPMRVESVAWLAERRDVLSGLFFMLTLGAYDAYVRHRPSLWRYLAVLVLFSLGLLAKSILVTVPPLLLLLDYWPLGRFRGSRLDPVPGAAPAPFPWRTVWDKLPLLALAIAAAGVQLLTRGTPSEGHLPLPERLAGAAVSCVAYLGQMFVPIDLSIFYCFPAAGWPAWQVVASALLLLAITVAALVSWRKYPYFFVGWFWFVGLLLPVMEIIPVGEHARADRYTYLSQIGLYIALVWGGLQLAAAWPAGRKVLACGAVLILAALAAGTWRQTGFWQTSKTLWQHALDCDPTNVVALAFLGNILEVNEKNDEAAAVEYRSVVEAGAIERNLYRLIQAQARNGLGNIAARQGDVAGAIGEYQQALKFDPRSWLAHNNLGLMLMKSGDLDGAAAEFERMIELKPDAPLGYVQLGLVRLRQEKTDDAIRWFEKALTVDDHFKAAHVSLAAVLAKQGNFDAAIDHLRRAIDINPADPLLYRQIAQLLRRQGRTQEAAGYEEQGAHTGRH